ncbi:MAG: RNA polymerase sigma factor [Anaerolineales bacterium]|nr:RNA polymerase sigma factor [Anaerolineales bacterium]
MVSLPAFTTLVDQYSSEIFSYLSRILQDSSEAEDCLQETYLRALRAYPRLRHNTNLRAWLYKIATNQAFTQLKKRKHINELLDDIEYLNPNNSSEIEPGIERGQLLLAVRQSISLLPEKQRAAFLMRKYQQLSYAQIAIALECSQESARANVYQALKKIRTQFNNGENYHE